jgi:hypothetical protein
MRAIPGDERPSQRRCRCLGNRQKWGNLADTAKGGPSSALNSSFRGHRKLDSEPGRSVSEPQEDLLRLSFHHGIDIAEREPAEARSRIHKDEGIQPAEHEIQRVGRFAHDPNLFRIGPEVGRAIDVTTGKRVHSPAFDGLSGTHPGHASATFGSFIDLSPSVSASPGAP